MPRRSHARSRARSQFTPRCGVGVLAALALVAAIALGWGLPVGAVELASSARGAHALRAAEVAADSTVAVAAPVVEALVLRVDRHAAADHVRDVLGATAVAVALLLLVAQRRRLSFDVARSTRAAVVAHGDRAPPV